MSRAQLRRRADGGQAAVELALALPLVMMVLLGAVQVALVARDQIGVVHAAREGARAAAVGADPRADGTEAALEATTLERSRMKVFVTEADGRVRVDVAYSSPTDVPLVGAVLGDADLRASALMRVEAP